ncbi:MAG: hypothetical protein MJ175_11445 [Clostridia bacterium]|nr:hypothetical protein [Clostridia bacterium]
MASNEIPGGTPGDIGEMLRTVLSDPESMGKLTEMAKALSGTGILDGIAGGAGKESSPARPGAKEDNHQNTAKPQIHPKGKHADLLFALRPYMSTHRQERIDRMLKLLQIAELAETMMRTV